MPLFFTRWAKHQIRRANTAAIFQDLYGKNGWIFGSGEGSKPEIARPYVEFLKNFLRKKNIRSVVDVGCGDWQFSRLIAWGNIQYLGLDIAPEVIEENQRQIGSENISFALSDVTKETPPPADLVLLKDVFQHWPIEAINAWLPKLKNYRYGLITNDTYERTNIDIDFGEHRAVDITLPPFNFPAQQVLEYSGIDVSGKPWRKVTYLYVSH